MAGTVMAVGVLGAAAALSVGLATVGAAAVHAQQAAAAADAAALAAADTASGAIAGTPCPAAATVAAAGGAHLSSCVMDDLVATVSVSVPFGPFTARAAARAGPPGPARTPGSARSSPAHLGTGTAPLTVRGV